MPSPFTVRQDGIAGEERPHPTRDECPGLLRAGVCVELAIRVSEKELLGEFEFWD